MVKLFKIIKSQNLDYEMIRRNMLELEKNNPLQSLFLFCLPY